MSAFTSEWLALREPADLRARNKELEASVAARFALRSEISVLDLGSGTGANLRAVAPMLPERQHWTLCDNDPALLEDARTRLAAWAESCEARGDNSFTLRKDRLSIDVELRQVDLAKDLPTLLEVRPQLVTASAFFDLVSTEYIRKLVSSVAAVRAALYATLTFNGLQRWTPHRPLDNQITAAFHGHQLRDKGFGSAAGPAATAELTDQLRLNGYVVLEGQSDWRLVDSDRMLIDELVRGQAVAALEMRAVPETAMVGWVNVKRTAALIGHDDVFAVPG